MQNRYKSKVALAMGCGAHIIQDGLSAALYLLLPLIAQNFGLSLGEVGLMRAVKSGIETFLEIPSGILAEKYGERNLLCFGLLCAGFGFLILFMAINIYLVTFGFLIIGIGGAFQHALSSAIISKAYSPQARKSALGLYNSSGDAGKLLFTGLFGLAIGYNIVWQNSVLTMGIAAIGFGGLLLFILYKYNIGGGALKINIATEAHQQKGWGILHKSNFCKLCLSVFFDTMVQATFFVFIVFFIIEKGADVKIASLALILTLIGGMFGKAGCGFLAARLGMRAAFIVIKICAAMAILSLGFVNLYLCFIILPILGMFLQGSTSITYGSIADLIDANKQSRGFAMVYTISSASSILGPVIFGYIGDVFGLDMTMFLLACVSLIAFTPILSYRLIMPPQ